MLYFIYVVNKIVQILNILLLLRVFVSWFPMRNSFVEALYSVTEPFLAPIRRSIYPWTRNLPFDLSVIVAYFLIQLARTILFEIIRLFLY